MSKNVTILSFSSRTNGNCANISNYLSNYYNRTNVYTYTIDAETVQPCGKCDCECLNPDVHCPHLSEEYRTLMDTVCESDLVYFIVPNYCGYPCGNYFAYNERSVGYFDLDRSKMNAYMAVPKRFVIVSNTEGFEAAMKQQTSEEPEILYLKSGKYKKSSIAGDILESAEARADLDTFLVKTDLCLAWNA